MTPYLLTILSGAAVLVSCMSLGLWQILSAPDRPNYPTSGPIKRVLMFWVCAGLGYRGVEIIDKADGLTPIYATAGQVVTSILLASLFVTFLVDHCRNWLPARTWHRIQQLLTIARCRPSKGLVDARTSAMVNSTGEPCLSADVVTPALVELHMQGVRVVGPGEGPSALHGR